MLFPAKPYVWDTSSLSQIFRFYYPKNFPSLWQKFNLLVIEGKFLSTREVFLELADTAKVENAHKWAKERPEFFPDPTDEETRFVISILEIRHFQQILQSKKGKPKKRAADLFVIAQAKRVSGTVVTEEAKPRNGARIPNVCEYFDIPCLKLQQLMDREDWVF
ncbi:MAG: DUF4411 family protein [Chloroflexi bacterium]|nr:DUF4411 family protein [Chloroflexota bacterium]